MNQPDVIGSATVAQQPQLASARGQVLIRGAGHTREQHAKAAAAPVQRNRPAGAPLRR
jgi:hypothetical protein